MSALRHNTALLAVLAIALVLRVAAVAGQPDLQPAFDAGDYERHALSIAAGHGYPDTGIAAPGTPTALRPPLYPYLLGAIYTVTGDSRTAARLAGVLLGLLAVVLVFQIGRALWSPRAGLIAAGLAAVSPSLVLLNSSLISEQVFIPLVLALVLAMIHARDRPGVRWAMVLGLLCGLAALTRVVGLLLVAPAALAVWKGRPRLSPRALAAPLAVVAAAALTVAPWSVRNTLEFDRFVPLATQEGFNLFGVYNAESAATEPRGTWVFPPGLRESRGLFGRPGLDEAEISERLGRKARDYVLDHPLYPLEVAARNAPRLFGIGDDPVTTRVDHIQTGVPAGLRGVVDLSVLLTLALGLLGAARLVVGRVKPGPPVVWLVPAVLFAGAVFFYAVPRYRVPLDPFLVLLAAGGAASVRR